MNRSRRLSLLFVALFVLSAPFAASAAADVDPPGEGAGPTDPAAQFELGMRYGRGEGVPRDDYAARTWLARAAAGGHPRARHALGWLYYDGRGVPRDYPKAAELFGYAAERGDPEAQYMMGVLHAEGKGVAKDSRRSILWMRKAAGQGHPGARQVLRSIFGPAADSLP